MAGKTRSEEPADVEEDVGIRDVFIWSATRLWGFWALSCVLTSWLLREPLMLRQSWHECKSTICKVRQLDCTLAVYPYKTADVSRRKGLAVQTSPERQIFVLLRSNLSDDW